MTNLWTAFKSTLAAHYVWLTLTTAASLSIMTYVLTSNLLHAISVAVVTLVFDITQRLFEISHGLSRRPLWERQTVSPYFRIRIIQLIMVIFFWAIVTYFMIWSDDVKSLLVATAFFGITMFLMGEWQAWRARR